MYRAPESSESESEPSDKEVDQQLEDSSDQVSESVLSPLTGLSLIAQGKSKESDPRPPEPHRTSDPFDEEFEDAEEPEKSDEPEEDLKEPQNLVIQDHRYHQEDLYLTHPQWQH